MLKKIKNLYSKVHSRVKAKLSTHERTLAKGTAIAFTGIFAVNVVSFIILAIKTRIMPASDVGILVLARSAVLIVFVLATGFSGAVFRYVAVFRGEGDKERVKGTIMLTYKYGMPCFLGMLVIVNLLAKYLAINVFCNPRLEIIIRIFSVVIFMQNIWGINASILRSKYLVQYHYMFQGASQIGMMIFLLIFYVSGWRNFILMFSFAWMAADFLVSIFSCFVIKKEFSFIFDKKVRSIEEKKDFFFYAFVSQITSLLIRFRLEANVFIMGFFLATSDIAVYNVAFQLGMAAMVILEGVNSIFPAIVGRLYGEKKIKIIKRLHIKTAAILGAIALAIFMVFLFFGKYILMIFGPDYEKALLPLLVIAVSFVIESGVGSVGRILNMMGKPHYNTVNTFISLILTIILCYKLIPVYGVLGAAISFSVSNIVKRLLMLAEVLFLYRLKGA